MNYFHHSIKSRLTLACFFVLSIFLISCKKKSEDSFFYIETNPSQLEQSHLENSIQNLSIKLSSSKEIRSLRLSEKRSNAATKIVLDTTLFSKQTTVFWDYKIPVYSKDASQYYLDMDVIFSNGNISTKRLIINIVRKDILLQESAGYVLYSRMSSKASGFDVNALRAVSPGLVPISSISFKDSSTSNTLSRMWISPAGGKFVRYRAGSFDYANATLAKVQDAYSASIKQELVSNIVEGDVIIYSQNSDYKLLRITTIIDSDSSQNDMYVFSLKKP